MKRRPRLSTIDRVLQLIREFRENPREGLKTLFIAVLVAVGGLGGTALGTQGAVGLYQVIIERVTFPMIHAEIESFRQDYENTPCEQRVMLRQQAAAWNQRIEHEHSANKQFFLIDWASTDRWNDVRRIQSQCDVSD